MWLVPVAAALGGLIVGFLVQRLAPETEGHGTDTVVQAFHRADGVLRARVTPVKLLGSAITIGSGGSAGREGPIALAEMPVVEVRKIRRVVDRLVRAMEATDVKARFFFSDEA